MRSPGYLIAIGKTAARAVLVGGLLASPAARAQAPAPVAPPAAVEAHPRFVEAGRVGIIGALTEDQWKGGVVYQMERFEAQFLMHMEFATGRRVFDVSVKVGGRAALGTLNYFAYGGEVRGRPGSKDEGVSVSSDVQFGPYISLERYFAATPVMLCLWVNPVQYDHGVDADGAGGVIRENSVRVFQTGGFGMAYLF